MLIALDDLPEDGLYFIANLIHRRNIYLVGARDGEEWTKYIERTGRVDGWIVAWMKEGDHVTTAIMNTR
jgi:hypothetical protein